MVIIGILIEIFVLAIIRGFLSIDSIDGITMLLINSIIIGIWIYTNKKITSKQKTILLIGFIARAVLIVLGKYISLPYSTGDVDGFHYVATKVSNDLSLLSEELYCAPYTKIMGIIYYFIGNEKMYIQIINTVLGIMSIYNIFLIINNFKIKNNTILELILVFLPQTLLISISLLRESIIIWLITLSVRLCMQYILKADKKSIICAILAVLIAAIFHSGVIFIICGYVFILGFYDVKTKKSNLTIKKVVIFSIIVLILMLIYNRYSDIIGNRFHNMDVEKISESFGKNSGGSAYLKGVKATGIKGLILYSIPKLIYFLFSPMPWNWRNIADIISFITDSMVYLYIIYIIIRYNRRVNKDYKFVINSLILGVVLTIVVYSLGTGNAGTAIRHRHKFLSVLIIIAMFSKHEKEINTLEDKSKLNKF